MSDDWIVTNVSAADAATEPGKAFLEEYRDRILRTRADGSIDMRWRVSELRKVGS